MWSMLWDSCPTGFPSAQGEPPAELCCSPVAPPDVRGLWIYRLDSRSRVNYRLRCLAWLEAEPAPDSWNGQLPPCPCSQPQAELDPRYRQSRGAKNNTPLPPNPHPANPEPSMGGEDGRKALPALGLAVIPPHHFRPGGHPHDDAAHCIPQPSRSRCAVSVPRRELARRLARENVEPPHPPHHW